MTRSASIELSRSQGLSAAGCSGRGVHFPLAAIGRLQPCFQAHPDLVGESGLAGWRRAWAGLRPRHMMRTWAVASLAGYAEIGPRRRVCVCRQIVVLFEIGRMTIGALVIPCMVAAGPVQQR